MASSPSKSSSPNMVTDKKLDVTSCQDGVVNLEPILETLGPKGRYFILQYCLQVLGVISYSAPWFCLLFQAYEPDHTCKEVDNTTQLESYLDDNVSIASLASVQYGRCSIDVILNDSGVVTSHSLGCVNGVSFSSSPDISVVAEWSLVCENAGLAKLGWSLPFIIQIAGITICAYLADWYGRKKVYVFCGLALMTSGFATSLAPNFPVYMAFTVVNMALSKGTMNSAYTMFIEMLPYHSRHVAPVVEGVAWSGGCVILSVMGYLTQTISWRYANLAFCSFYLYVLVLPCVLDESLRWLLATGHTDQALQVLRKACKQNGKSFHDVARSFTEHHHHNTLLMEQQMEIDKFHDAPSKEVLLNPYGEDNVMKPQTQDSLINPEQTSSERRNGKEVADMADDGVAPIDQERHVLLTDCLDYQNRVDDDIVMSNGRDGARENFDHISADGQGFGLSGVHTDDTATEGEETKPKMYRFFDIFRYRITLVNILVYSSYWTICNFYYYFLMLPTANPTGDRFLNFGVLSLVEIPSNIMTFFLIPRFDRKPLTIFFGMSAAIFMFLSEVLAYIDRIAAIGVLWPRIMLYIGKFCIIGSFSLLNVYFLEIFPTEMRTTAVGIADAIARLAPITSAVIISSTKDFAWIRGVVTGCVCILVSLSVLLTPETRNRKLPDSIEEIKSWRSTRSQGMQGVAK